MNTSILSKYDISENDVKLGEGTYGTVIKTYNKETRKMVAIKKIKIDQKDEGIPSTAIRELSILKHCNFPNILPLNEQQLNKNQLQMIFDLQDSDLKRYILKNAPLPLVNIKRIMYELFLSLVYCHKRRIVHRDLKPQNILIDHETMETKLCDFGLARSFRMPMNTLTHEVVTLWQRCPEILMGKKRYDLSVDIWSAGCIFVEMANRKPLFQGDSEIDQIFKIFKNKGTPDDSIWPGISEFPDQKKSFPKWKENTKLQDGVKDILTEDGVNLLKSCWEQVPEKRITALDALKHPFFNDLNVDMFKKQFEILKKY